MKYVLTIGIVAVAIGMCAVCTRQGRTGDSNARQEREHVDAQYIVSLLNSNIWTRPLMAARPLQELDERLLALATSDQRRKFLMECADGFIKMDADLEARVRARNNSDNYIRFAERLFNLMVSNDVDDAVCMDFFLQALERHKTDCLSRIPREAEMDYRTWAAWNEVLDWLQVNLNSDLMHLYGELEKSCFVLERNGLNAELYRRFKDFYVPATNEIATQISDRRKHPRCPPPIAWRKASVDESDSQEPHESGRRVIKSSP